jgi:DNA-binding NarL/FixJ family response regulator
VILSNLGHHVVAIVSSAAAAIAAAAEHRPDIAFMDVELAEGTDGVEAAVEIRKRFGIRSVFFSGYADVPDIRKWASKAEPLAFIDKTQPPHQIEAALNEVASKLLQDR